MFTWELTESSLASRSFHSQHLHTFLKKIQTELQKGDIQIGPRLAIDRGPAKLEHKHETKELFYLFGDE
jgi:hypothetical protein